MKKKFRDFISNLSWKIRIVGRLNRIDQTVARESRQTRLLLGRILAHQVRGHGLYENLRDAEFQVFSQFGDDGILQYLIHHTNPTVKKFIEFGVEDYSEANTRFLLMNDNWSGLIMDGNAQGLSALRKDEIYWRYDLTAVGAFITCENANSLFLENGVSGEIGLLSIDIDGNDYWIWKAINVVNPVLVVIEYNSVFGAEHAVTIPYDPTFNRTKAHYSNLYWGASLKALCQLAESKGYSFVGCNSAGNNAHFVRKDRVGDIPVKSAADGYVESKFRESRDEAGHLNFLRGAERLREIKDLAVFDLDVGKQLLIKDVWDLP